MILKYFVNKNNKQKIPSNRKFRNSMTSISKTSIVDTRKWEKKFFEFLIFSKNVQTNSKPKIGYSQKSN